MPSADRLEKMTTASGTTFDVEGLPFDRLLSVNTQQTERGGRHMECAYYFQWQSAQQVCPRSA